MKPESDGLKKKSPPTGKAPRHRAAPAVAESGRASTLLRQASRQYPAHGGFVDEKIDKYISEKQKPTCRCERVNEQARRNEKEEKIEKAKKAAKSTVSGTEVQAKGWR